MFIFRIILVLAVLGVGVAGSSLEKGNIEKGCQENCFAKHKKNRIAMKCARNCRGIELMQLSNAN